MLFRVTVCQRTTSTIDVVFLRREFLFFVAMHMDAATQGRPLQTLFACFPLGAPAAVTTAQLVGSPDSTLMAVSTALPACGVVGGCRDTHLHYLEGFAAPVLLQVIYRT